MKCLIYAVFLVTLGRIVESGFLRLPHSLRPDINGKICEPGTQWRSRCNDCSCTQDGRPLCEQNTCPGQDVYPELNCSPGSRWMNGCNSCWCTAAGKAVCTRIGCDQEVTMDFAASEEKELETKLFEAGSKIKSHNEENKSNKTVVCVANRMFIRDCNTCWCNEDGTSYFCTRKVCVPELPDESAPEEGKHEELRVIQKECRPDEVFEIDCNMCRCNPDGKSFSCTRRACVEQPEDDNKNVNTASRKTRGAQLNQKELPKNCQPGQEFRMDCNKCLCDNEGQDFSCTRIDCNALNNNNNGGTRRKRDATEQVNSECTPGSVFERGCNVCRCKSDGLSADCTTHTCDTTSHSTNALNNDVNAPAPESESGFRCNPGEQFKRSCNDCTCSADGRSVFCTLRLCDKDLVPSI